MLYLQCQQVITRLGGKRTIMNHAHAHEPDIRPPTPAGKLIDHKHKTKAKSTMNSAQLNLGFDLESPCEALVLVWVWA